MLKDSYANIGNIVHLHQVHLFNLLNSFFMANNAFLATLYAEVQTFDAKNSGVQIYGNGYPGPAYRSFPVVGTQVTALSPAQVITTAFGSVTANSIIEILPSGLSTPGFTRKFLCDATVSALNTART